MFDILISDGKLVDGTGAPWRYTDVGIVGGRIAAVGQLQGREARQHIEARGQVVCPGFIDIHSHADMTLLAGRWMDGRLRQGITTEVIGQDGLAYAPVSPHRLDEWRRYLIGLNGDFPGVTWDWVTVGDLLRQYANKASNVVYLIPHGAVRVEVMGWDARPATQDELRAMQDLVRQGLKQGAAGISTGLTYMPCAHATTEEMVALCEPVAQAGGIYATHLRSYGAQLFQAIDEAIAIGRRSGAAVQISHLRVADLALWGTAPRMLERLDQARAGGVDVTFDIYPYTVGCAPLFCLLPPRVQAGGPDAILARLRDLDTQQRMSDEMKSWKIDWSVYVLSNAPHNTLGDWEGYAVTSAAQAMSMDTTQFIVALLRETELNATIVAAGGNETDNEALFRHPASMLCSDGVLVGGQPHPRGYGAYPRTLAQYVRGTHSLRLEEAIHKMAGAPANRLNLQDRGVLRAGAAADVVILSPDTVADGATFRDGRRPPVGIDEVLVNGQVVVHHGEYIGSTHGVVLTPLQH